MALLRIGGAPGLARAGRPLLAAPANVVPSVGGPAPDPSTMTDAEYARAWVDPLVMGFNVERWRPTYMSWRGSSLASSTAYYLYLKDLGITHIRLYMPYKPTQDLVGSGWISATRPPLSAISTFLDVAETIIRAGLKVILDCTDVLNAADFASWRPQVEAHLDAFGQQIAARGQTRLPPSMLAVGPYGGLEQEPGSVSNELRLAGHRILRARLAGYVLVTGAGRWSQPGALLDPSWQMVQDQRTIIQWHDWSGVPQPTYLQGLWQQYQTLSAANGGVPIIGGEAAVGSLSYSSDWSALIDLYATYMPKGRPTWWVITDSASYNFGSSATDPTLRPELETAVRAAVAKIKAGGGTTTPAPGGSGLVRARPIISGGTVKSAEGTMLRGVTMALDGPGTPSTAYAKNRANWQKFRDLKFNVVRLDVPLSDAHDGPVTLAQQLPDLDVVVDNAAATGMYIQVMCGGPYGVANYDEQRQFWGTVAGRYKDRTHVFYEPNNEPHYSQSEYTSGDLDNIAEIYHLIHDAAPNTLVGVLCPAAVTNVQVLIGLCDGLVGRGVTFGPAFVAFHGYDQVQDAAYQALRDAYPCVMTEFVWDGGTFVPSESVKVLQMERLGIAWQLLQVRWGEVTYPDGRLIGAHEDALTKRIIPELVDAGSYNWQQDVLDTTTPPPGGGTGGGTTPEIVSITGDMANAVVGQTTVLTVTAVGMTHIEWVIVSSTWVWRTDPVVVALNASGQCTINFVPIAVGDFVKAMSSPGQEIELDSAPVPGAVGGGGGTVPPTTGSKTFFEGFDNNTSGQLTHIWGNRNALSFSNGILRLDGIPGLAPNDTAVGVMQRPGGADWGFGYGLYEIRARMSFRLGDGSGPAILIWPADDIWPGGEVDIGEVSRDGWFYMANHYIGGYDANGDPYDGYQIIDAPGHNPETAFNTYAVRCERGRNTFMINGNVIGTATRNVVPMYVDGGVNRVLGVMNRSSNTWLEVEHVAFTAE